jgi:formate hydrogenlyase subunit 3/multisubunit Na+/H+ antiporter MnhD subunit
VFGVLICAVAGLPPFPGFWAKLLSHLGREKYAVMLLYLLIVMGIQGCWDHSNR